MEEEENHTVFLKNSPFSLKYFFAPALNKG